MLAKAKMAQECVWSCWAVSFPLQEASFSAPHSSRWWLRSPWVDRERRAEAESRAGQTKKPTGMCMETANVRALRSRESPGWELAARAGQNDGPHRCVLLTSSRCSVRSGFGLSTQTHHPSHAGPC